MSSKRRSTKKPAAEVDTTAFGERLKAARVDMKLSQPGLGARAGVAPYTIWRAEKSGRITPWLAERVAPVLGIKPESLMSVRTEK